MSAAIIPYVPPERAIMMARLAAPLPHQPPVTRAVSPYTVLITPPPHRYRVGQAVVVPMTRYEITARGPREITVFQAAKIARCHRHAGENWYEVHIARQEGNTYGYKAFPFGVHEDAIRLDVSLDFAQAVVQTTHERRLVTAEFAPGLTERTMERTRDGLSVAA